MANNYSKPLVSRFKANRIASAYGIPTGTKTLTSTADSVLPESSARTVQRAIRSGRIDDDNHLVGGDRDSDSEVEMEGLQETLELLKKGEVYNLGPNGQYFHARSPTRPSSIQETSAAATTSLNADKSAVAPSEIVAQQQGLQHRSLPPLNRPKTSKFKADRSQSGRLSAPTHLEISTSPIPLLSSSKLSQALPGGVDNKQSERQGINALQETLSSPLLASTTVSPAIIDSPSFTTPGANPNQFNTQGRYTPVIAESRFVSASTVSGPSTSFPSMIVDSPSFPPPGQRARRPERPPTIVTSRNFTTDLPTELDAAKRSLASTPLSGTARVESSHTVAPIVLERASAPRNSVSAAGFVSMPEKVSRFKQSRDGHS